MIYTSEPSADETSNILRDVKARFIVVQDQEQVDKVLKIKTQCPSLEEIIFCDPRGMRHYNAPCLARYEEIRRIGHEFDVQHPRYFLDQVALGTGEDIAFILHTAGSTGRPKAVLLTHNNLITTAGISISQLKLSADEEVLAFQPMATATSILFYLTQPLIAGFCVNFPESAETILADMRDIGPTFFFASPHFYKSLANLVTLQMTEAHAIKRYLFNYLIAKVPHNSFSVLDSLIMIGPLKNVLGLSHMRTALTTGDASPSVHDFYRALGINLRQFYGPTEGCCFVSLQPDNLQERLDNVGIAVNNVKIDITPQGEVIFMGPTSFRGYHNSSQTTLEIKSPDGWTRTGDAGFITNDRRLNILGPILHRNRLKDGKEFFPLSIERRLKFSPHIREAIIFGHERPYVTALVIIDLTAVASWAKQHNLAYSGYSDLTQHDAVYALVKDVVKDVNRYFNDSGEPYLQIRRFVILPRSFSTDAGEITLTGKLRRAVIEETYADLVEAMYIEPDGYGSSVVDTTLELRCLTPTTHAPAVKACTVRAC